MGSLLMLWDYSSLALFYLLCFDINHSETNTSFFRQKEISIIIDFDFQKSRLNIGIEMQ